MLNFRLARPSALVDLSELGLDGIRLETEPSSSAP